MVGGSKCRARKSTTFLAILSWQGETLSLIAIEFAHLPHAFETRESLLQEHASLHGHRTNPRPCPTFSIEASRLDLEDDLRPPVGRNLLTFWPHPRWCRISQQDSFGWPSQILLPGVFRNLGRNLQPILAHLCSVGVLLDSVSMSFRTIQAEAITTVRMFFEESDPFLIGDALSCENAIRLPATLHCFLRGFQTRHSKL